jgi:hypothetical protein
MNFQIPVQHLFTVVLDGLNNNSYAFKGPFGSRQLEKAIGGAVTGAAMNGRVLELLATDYGRVSDDSTLRAYNASVTLRSDDATTILMQYRGRSSPRYGTGQSRIQALFQAPEGPYRWLNGIQAIGYGTQQGEATVLEIFALTCEPGSEGPDDARPAAERLSVPGEFIFRRRSAHIPGAPRHVLRAPLGTRYFTLAEGGGTFAGPSMSGDFISGFSWSPHRMLEEEGGGLLLQYDVDTYLRTNDGTSILMSYTGVSSPRYPKGFWMTAALFETGAGPHEWLNQVQAVGFGAWKGDGAEYHIYALL